MDSMFGPGFDSLLLHYVLPNQIGKFETNLGLSDSSEVFSCLILSIQD